MAQAVENSSKMIASWLFACCGLVFALVVVGAITRLSDAGLSMVEWRPLMGALPPLSEEEWGRVFELYQDSPEYQKKHFWMGTDDFKFIFFWEWFHRLLGRLIGLVYAGPLIWFWVKGMIPKGYKIKLLGLLALGGAQGLMGWYMVQSGLVDEPAVSHYRLAAHLGLAFLIFSLLLWTGLSLRPVKKHPNGTLYGHGWIVLLCLVVTVLWGAFTAGLDAGLLYNESFPKMGSQWIPEGFWHYHPAWLNFFENRASVQFVHRWLALLTGAMVFGFWLHGIKKENGFTALHMLAMMIVLQIGLGIATLFTQVALPVAALHQAGALITLALLLICLKQLKPESA